MLFEFISKQKLRTMYKGYYAAPKNIEGDFEGHGSHKKVTKYKGGKNNQRGATKKKKRNRNFFNRRRHHQPSFDLRKLLELRRKLEHFRWRSQHQQHQISRRQFNPRRSEKIPSNLQEKVHEGVAIVKRNNMKRKEGTEKCQFRQLIDSMNSMDIKEK